MKDLLNRFEDYFELVPANTEQLLDTCQHFRYQVFCEEQHILQGDRTRMEHDLYDSRSVHTLLRHRATGNYAALVRLVLPDPHKSRFSYPMEEHLQVLSTEQRQVFQQIPRHHTAEISRFSVSKCFRRRPHEEETNHGITSQFGRRMQAESRRFDSFITLGLFKAIVRMSAEQGITHWLAFMEPSLIRLLGRVGIRFNAVGPLIDHCGKRHACVEDAHRVLEGIRQMRPDIWDFITSQGRYQLDTTQHAHDALQLQAC